MYWSIIRDHNRQSANESIEDPTYEKVYKNYKQMFFDITKLI